MNQVAWFLWFFAASMVAIVASIALYARAREWLTDWHDDGVARSERRVVAYLREQSRIADIVGRCRYLSELGREQEKYAAAVLDETAAEISEGAHNRVKS